jgi:hypothetical protein
VLLRPWGLFMPSRCAIWARVSTDEQETGNQLAELRQWAARRSLDADAEHARYLERHPRPAAPPEAAWATRSVTKTHSWIHGVLR